MKHISTVVLLVVAASLAAPALAGAGPTVPAPEPATLALLAAGLGTVALVRRFRAAK